MITTRRTSIGCGNCRRAKKGCDLKIPTCGRCQRLNHACGDCPGQLGNNVRYLRLDTLASTKIRTALLKSLCLDSRSITSNRNVGDPGLNYLSGDWSLLFDVFASHELVERVIALFMSLLQPGRRIDAMEISTANASRVDVMKLVRVAVVDARKRQEDATLVASILLASFERFDWPCVKSPDEWTIHADGVRSLVENRGISQLRTKTGRDIFRKARQIVIDAAFGRDIGAPSFIILYSQAMKYDAENNMDDQLAILEARATHLWSRYLAPDCYRSLYEGSLTLRQDLELLEQDYCISPIEWRRNFTDCSTKQCFRAGKKIQDQWYGIRLETCRVIVLRIEAGYCGRKWQNGEPPPESWTAQARTTLPSTRHQLYTSAASALKVVEGSRLSDVPAVSALCLAIPLYIITTALIDESHEEHSHADLESEQYGGSLELLKTQISYAMEVLKHFHDTAGDQNSLRLLSAVKKRQYKGDESFPDGSGDRFAEQDF